MNNYAIRQKVDEAIIRNYAKKIIFDLIVNYRGEQLKKKKLFNIIDVEVCRPSGETYAVYLSYGHGDVLWHEEKTLIQVHCIMKVFLFVKQYRGI